VIVVLIAGIGTVVLTRAPATTTIFATTTASTTAFATTTASVTTATATASVYPLSVVTWGGDYVQTVGTVATNFTAATNVPVLLGQQGYATSTLATIEADWPNVDYNVVTTTPFVAYSMYNASYLAPLNPSVVTNLANVPSQNELIENGQVYAVSMGIGTMVIAWNTNLYPQGCGGISCLYNANLKGHVGIPGPSGSSGAFLLNLAEWKGGNESDIQPGIQAAITLAKTGNIGLVGSTDNQQISAMETGQVWVQYMWVSDYFTAKAAGAPLNAIFVFNDTKAFSNADQAVIINGSGAHVLESEQFINFMLGLSYENLWTSTIGEIPAENGATMPALLLPYVPSVAAAETAIFVPNAALLAANDPSWINLWNTQVQPDIS